MTAQEVGVDGAALRQTMGHFATGVTVVTSRDADGTPVGATACAVSSVSLDPPLVLTCLNRASRTLAAIRDNAGFAINVLAADQEKISQAFAKSGNSDAFTGVTAMTGATGSPLLVDAHAVIDCAVERVVDGGDHEILLGRVLGVRQAADGSSPLLVHRGAYGALSPATAAAPTSGQPAPAEIVECSLPTRRDDARLLGTLGTNGDTTVAYAIGDPAAHPAPIVHARTACVLGEALGGLACDCRARRDEALDAMRAAGAGVLLVTRREGLSAFDCRRAEPDLDAAAVLLRGLGIDRVALLEGDAALGEGLRLRSDIRIERPALAS